MVGRGRVGGAVGGAVGGTVAIVGGTVTTAGRVVEVMAVVEGGRVVVGRVVVVGCSLDAQVSCSAARSFVRVATTTVPARPPGVVGVALIVSAQTVPGASGPAVQACAPTRTSTARGPVAVALTTTTGSSPVLRTETVRGGAAVPVATGGNARVAGSTAIERTVPRTRSRR